VGRVEFPVILKGAQASEESHEGKDGVAKV
jgi:hypothetical protein